MGKYKQGILGPFSGRVGNIIGTFWKGKCIMRIRAANYSDANSIPQQTQRMKWKLASAFAKANERLISLGFGAADTGLTAYNSALKWNIPEAITGVFPELKFDFSKASLSRGTLTEATGFSAVSNQAGKLTIAYDDNSDNMTAFADDQMHLSIINSDNGNVIIPAEELERSTEGGIITLPGQFSGKRVYVLGFFARKGITKVTNPNQVSNTVYFGQVLVA